MQVIMYQANAFTDKILEGSPIGIVPDAKKLREEDMKNIVKITNLNKIAFITDSTDECYSLRFFNSEQEVRSCDCATLASFYALAERGYIEEIEEGIVRVYECTEMGKRPIDIHFKDWEVEKVELCDQEPILISDDIDLNLLSQLLNINSEGIGLTDLNANPVVMFKGSKDMIVPVKTDEILNSIVVDIDKLKKHPLTHDLDKLYVFSIDDEEMINYICFELIVKEECIYEETASGLIYYIKSNKIIKKDKFKYKNKSNKNRHSYMHCNISENKEEYPIKIGGRASIYLEGVVTYGDTII